MKRDVVDQWNDSAAYWEKHRLIMRTMFAPVTAALIEEAEITSGQTVLDVATGQGEPALSISGVVGGEGRVFGVDLVSNMVTAAQREADQRQLGNTRFQVATAENLPFPAGTFDAVVSRFGVMFFPSPLNAIREMLRVLKPGQKIVMAAWPPVERNPFHQILMDGLSRYVDLTPPEPDSPEPFRFSSPGKLLHLLKQAGAFEAFERTLLFSIHAPISVEEFWTVRSEISDRLRSELPKLPEATTAQLREDVLGSLREYSTGNTMRLPAEVLIVAGRKR
jgi:SAM-dependent methyltransferase